ncbi:EAL domain-containing protein [Nitrospirillum pindoramense]|uniref:GGDEF domain-containing protein n=1 Tax=Nitrospirillum amazonense TaxID=28077 RepID=A0A560H0G1_9PROT|nr:EAL domain-containing protein [Nitrospirillum amazonense]TWB39765.1 hypothetical protein FBZ90_110230 [Nitrospirillum amazonense]
MSGLLRRIIDWFSEEPERAAGGREPRAPAGSGNRRGARRNPDETMFRQRLKAVLGPRSSAAAGCVQFVGLDSLKERLGSRWGAVQPRVHAMVERLLRQTLGAGDVYYGYGSETYVIVFARLNALQASLVCAKVVQELQRMLLGEPDLSSIVVRTAAREASGNLILKPERLADLLADLASRAGPSPGDASTEGPMTETSAAHPDGASQASPPAVPFAGQDASVRDASGPPSTASLSSAPLPSLSSVQTPLSQAAAALVELGRGTVATTPPLGADDPWLHLRPVLGPLEFAYRPVWDVRGQALSLYVASPRRQRIGGRQYVYGYETLTDAAGGVVSAGTANGLQEILDLDRETLRQAVDAYLELYDNRFRYYLALPVHFETLAGTVRRRAYLDLAGHIPAHLLPFITYQLMGVPDGVPLGRLTELVSALKPLGRGVTVSADLAPQAYATFAAGGVKGVAVSLGAAVPRGRLIPDLHLAAAEARRRGLHLMADGIDTPEMERMAEEAGCAFMMGDLIGPWVDVPGHASRLSRADVLDQGPSQEP